MKGLLIYSTIYVIFLLSTERFDGAISYGNFELHRQGDIRD